MQLFDTHAVSIQQRPARSLHRQESDQCPCKHPEMSLKTENQTITSFCNKSGSALSFSPVSLFLCT